MIGFRCNNDSRIVGCHRYGNVGSGVRDECVAWSSIFPNFTNGSDGPTWWYLEVAR